MKEKSENPINVEQKAKCYTKQKHEFRKQIFYTFISVLK